MSDTWSKPKSLYDLADEVVSKLNNGPAGTDAPLSPAAPSMQTSGAQPNSSGRIQLPQNAPDSGYYNYGTPGNGAAQWGRPETIDLIKNIGAQWKSLGGSNLGIGNIGLENGSRFHAGHGDGLAIDVRPPRMDGRPVPLPSWKDPAYDRDATQQLVDMLHASGNVQTIYFNDPHINGVAPLDGHDDHLHVKVRKQ